MCFHSWTGSYMWRTTAWWRAAAKAPAGTEHKWKPATCAPAGSGVQGGVPQGTDKKGCDLGSAPVWWPHVQNTQWQESWSTYSHLLGTRKLRRERKASGARPRSKWKTWTSVEDPSSSGPWTPLHTTSEDLSAAEETHARVAELVNQWTMWLECERQNRRKIWFLIYG